MFYGWRICVMYWQISNNIATNACCIAKFNYFDGELSKSVYFIFAVKDENTTATIRNSDESTINYDAEFRYKCTDFTTIDHSGASNTQSTYPTCATSNMDCDSTEMW